MENVKVNEEKVKIFDTTLRDGEQSPGCSMNLEEKLIMAKQLELLGVDIIEAGFAVCSPNDFEAVNAIAKTVQNATVASLARAVKKDIDVAFQAVKPARFPRIHTFLATSPIHMKYKLNMSPKEVLDKTFEMVSYARSLCEDIQFSAEDATRSEWDFLCEVYSTAIKAGATTLNVPDTVGYTTPKEMFDLISHLKKNVVGIDDVTIAVHCHDDLGLAVANSLAGITAGARQAECTMNGIGERAGNACMSEIVMGIKTRRDFYNLVTGVNTKQIYKTSKLLSTITGASVAANKAIVGANAFAHEAGIHQHGILKEKSTYEIMSPEDVGISQNKMILGKHSGKHALKDRLETLGYELDDEQLDKAFDSFKILADKKKTMTDKDIVAIVDEDAMVTLDQTYELVSFVVNSGSAISATAIVKLKKDDEFIEKVATGSGPIDAAFQAVNKITKSCAVLDDYIIHSVTEGEDALGEVVVKMHNDNGKATGRGLSTDIIEASIKAYINGMNKL